MTPMTGDGAPFPPLAFEICNACLQLGQSGEQGWRTVAEGIESNYRGLLQSALRLATAREGRG